MRIIWTPEAEQDRSAMTAARRIDRMVSEIARTRELTPHRSYRLVYEVVDEAIWILVLTHASRHWPPLQPASDDHN